MEGTTRTSAHVRTDRKAFTREDFRKRAWEDHRFFCRELFPMAFYLDFAPVHVEIMNLMFDPDPNVLVIAPRKIGKTPLICFSYPVKNILYHLEPYQVIVSETMDESRRHVQKITNALETNERVHHYFGNIVDRRNREVQKESVQFANGDWLRAKSYMSQIRGTSGDWTPPSLIIVDDPQSNKDVKTDRSLKDAMNWFEDEIMYSRARKWKHAEWDVIREGKVRVLGTSLHPFCLVEQLFKDSRFKHIRYGILMKDGQPDIVDGVSIWEDNFPTGQLYREMRDAEANGKLGNWLQERMNMPYQYGDRTFNVDDLRYWDVGTNRFDRFMGQPVMVLEEDIGLEHLTKE